MGGIVLRVSAKAIFVLLASILIFVGCSEEKTTSNQTPPIPKVMSERTSIPVTQGSYCWGNLGCADYAGGKAMLQGKKPTVVAPESKIEISFHYKPGPSHIRVNQLLGDRSIEIILKNGHLVAPKEKGIYYYWTSAYWLSDDGEHSMGDTSSFFFIEIK